MTERYKAYCPRCKAESVVEYDYRYQAICLPCLQNGYVVNLRLYVRETTDHEAVALTRDELVKA